MGRAAGCRGVMVRFDPGDAIYADHFPGCAVVPGSLIVRAFIMAAGREEDCAPVVARRFRFRRFVAPGKLYRCCVEKIERSAGRWDLRCTLYDQDRVMAEGVLR